MTVGALVLCLVLPVWTKYSTRFIDPPVLEFAAVEGAAKYEFSVIGADRPRRPHRLESDGPRVCLDSLWTKLPVGYVNIICEATGADGRTAGDVQTRFFWKKAAYRGDYPPAKCGYREAALKAYRYLAGCPQIRYIAEHGTPDPGYELNCYPSKMNAAIVKGMVNFARLDPSRRDEALAVARAATDYLLSVSEKPGSPLAGFPPTYSGEKLFAKRYAGQVMTLYPAAVAEAYLDLDEATGEDKYLEAAVTIGETFLRLQGADGTWPLKLFAKTAKEVDPNRQFPIDTAAFLERLGARTGRAEFRAAADRAFAYVDRGPLSDWNWEAQFEDQPPEGKYVNLNIHTPCDTAIFCLKRFAGDARRTETARALLRFAEDQFVDWERPYATTPKEPMIWGPHARGISDQRFDKWILPAAEEQYRTYAPVDSSAMKFALANLELYKATGDRTALAKARAMADTLTRVQREDGSIPTWWDPGRPRSGDWMNCMFYAADALLALDVK